MDYNSQAEFIGIQLFRGGGGAAADPLSELGGVTCELQD